MRTLAERFKGYNDVSPTTYKVVLVGYMQFIVIMISMLVWSYVMVVQMWHWDGAHRIDFHEGFLWIIFGLLGGLSGITLAGRGADRVTDYGYVERKYAGQAAVAAASAKGTPMVVSGDNPSVTQTMPVQPVPIPVAVEVPRRASTQVKAVEQEEDKGLG